MLCAPVTFTQTDGTLIETTRIKPTAKAKMLSLDGRWIDCSVRSGGRGLWIYEAAEAIQGGMSGSPIITTDGVIGLVTMSSGTDGARFGGGPNPLVSAALPGWLLTA
jgi:hypothetical protein